MNRTVLAFVSVLAVSACAPIQAVAYEPNPARIADPRTEARELILANTVQGCVSEPEVSETMLIVKFVCTGNSNGVGNAVVRFNDVESISLQQSGEWYRVLVHHTGGAADFAWTSMSLSDMQRLTDALTALSAPVSASGPASTGTNL